MSGPMVPFQWRRFAFFDLERIDNNPANEETIISQLRNSKHFLVFGGRGCLVLANHPGFLHFLKRDFTELTNVVSGFQHTIISMTGFRKHSYILAVGMDEEKGAPVLKIWNYDKIESGINPTLTRTLKLELPDFSCFAAHENLNYMAFGFKCGKVHLYHKDITRGRHSNRIILCDLHEEITGLVFSPMAKDVFLYISTPSSFHAFLIVDGTARKMYTDPVGCLPRQICPAQLTHPDQHVGIVCPEGVRFYGPDGMGSTCQTSQDGESVLINWQLDYLFVVTQEKGRATPSPTPSFSSVMPRTAVQKEESTSFLTVFDSINKFIGFTGSFRNLQTIISEFNSIFIFTSDGLVFSMVEKDLQSKMDLLFRKNQYELAIKLAKSQRYGDNGLVKIFKHYGDHLYSKGDYMSAAEQYRHTIRGLESSYVIRQLLTGAAPPGALALYLEGVHEMNKATLHHTSLLLNCYIKMKDSTKLKAFVAKYENSTTLDSETAIRVLRSAHYTDLALNLAKASLDHQQVVAIYVEDIVQVCDDPKKAKETIEEALAYIEAVDQISANACIRRYGQHFMMHAPEKTTTLMTRLLLQSKDEDSKPKQGFLFDKLSNEGNLAAFQIFHGRPEQLQSFLESIQKEYPSGMTPAIYHALVEVYCQNWHHCGSTGDFTQQAEYETKIMEILQNNDDKMFINRGQTFLLMFDSFKFYPGIEFLLEKMGRHQQLMNHLIDQGRFAKLADFCDRHCGKDSDQSMRLRLLSALPSSHEAVDLIPRVVQGFVGQDSVLPNQVLEALCRTESGKDVPLSCVHDYLIEELKSINQQADENSAIADSTRKEAVELRAKLEDLQENAVAFRETKCRSCNFKLELPTVHFLCQHSYHSTCLDYADPDFCPKCSKSQKEIIEQGRQFDEMRKTPRASVTDLAQVPDVFATISDLLAKGLLSGGSQNGQNGQKATAAIPPTPSSITAPSTNPFD